MAYVKKSFGRYQSRRYGSGSSTRRTRGNMRAASNMRDQTNVTLQGVVQVPVKCSAPDLEVGDENYTGTFANSGGVTGLSIWQLLYGTQFFDNYKGMFDQVKLNGFRCKIMGNSAATYVPASGLSSVSVVTGWDRSGIDGYVYIPGASDLTGAVSDRPAPYLSLFTMPSNGIAAVNRLLSYGSAKQKNWATGNAFMTYLSGYASTMAEKSQWLQMDRLSKTTFSKSLYVAGITRRHGYPSGLARYLSNPEESGTQGFIPDVENVDNAPAWDPVVMIGVFNVPTPATEEMAQDPVLVFTMEFKIDVSFRGARAGTTITGMMNQNTAKGGEVLDTLVQTVPAGATQTFTPANGFLWNKATVTAERVQGVEDYIGVDSTGNTILPTTDQVYPESTVADFTLDINRDSPVVVKNFGQVGLAPFQKVRFKVNLPQYSPLSLNLDSNGIYEGSGLYSGYRVVVRVPQSIPTLDDIIIYRRSSGTVDDILYSFDFEHVERPRDVVLDQYDYFIIIRKYDTYNRIYCLAQWLDEDVHNISLLAGDLFHHGRAVVSTQDLYAAFRAADKVRLLTFACNNDARFFTDVNIVVMNISF